jgi:hypothetical protein
MGARAGRLTVLVAARDEESTIGPLVGRLRAAFPGAEVVVADDGSRDRTAERARAAGATVVTGPRLGKGEALTSAERVAPPGPLLLCDADIDGDLKPLVESGCDLAVAAFARSEGGGFGIAKRAAGMVVEVSTGRLLAEPLSGQRYLSERARAACFPVARGFGCEVRMTIDALRAGLDVREIELDLRHRATGRDAAGFAHRGRQLVETVAAAVPLALNHRGNRLPLLGFLVPLAGVGAPRRVQACVAAVAAVGLLDDLYSGPERGWRAHLASGTTTGVLKLGAIPLAGALATRSISGGVVVGLAANALNQLDTKPGRAVKAFLAAQLVLRRSGYGGFAGGAVMLLPYDLREQMMLGDAGSNALGAVLGLESVVLDTRGRRIATIAALAGINVLGERVSLGDWIERAPILSAIDRAGRI